MVFANVPRDAEGNAINPYAGRGPNGEWQEGTISVDLLESTFGHLTTATEMKVATQSEGLRLYFDWLASQGIIPE